MRFMIFLVFFIPYLSHAGCFVVGELEGQSVRQAHDFELSEDRISSSKFIIEIDGENSSVTPNDMDCFQVGNLTVLCLGTSSIETWALFPASGKVVHTKSVNEFGPFNGGNLFVGEIKGQCD
jgi:hypothetical protein